MAISKVNRRQRRGKSWIGRTLGRDVACERCSSPITAGSHGYKREGMADDPAWICERCIT